VAPADTLKIYKANFHLTTINLQGTKNVIIALYARNFPHTILKKHYRPNIAKNQLFYEHFKNVKVL
jgi:hypothetical protein